MNRLICFLFFALVASMSCAQSRVKKSKNELVFSPEVSYQKQFFLGLGLIYADFKSLHDGSMNGTVVAGPKIVIGFNCNSANPIVITKMGYELSGQFVCLRANAVYYQGKQKSDLRLLPEIGFTLLGAVDLTYGIGFPLLKNRIDEVSRSTISLSFNLNKNLWRQL